MSAPSEEQRAIGALGGDDDNQSSEDEPFADVNLESSVVGMSGSKSLFQEADPKDLEDNDDSALFVESRGLRLSTTPPLLSPQEDVEPVKSEKKFDESTTPKKTERAERHERAESSEKAEARAEAEAEERRSRLEISLSEFEKRGDGMNSFVVFKVSTKSLGVPGFSERETHVWRRFSDFLGLYEKLVTKHQTIGRIVPSPPEKSVLGATKTKISKSVEEDADGFLERRRAALERFVRRVGDHPVLVLDPDFREFLTLEADLPKATQTSTLSGANVLRLIGRVGDTFNKMTIKVNETDRWFDDKQFEVETLEEELRNLHNALDTLVQWRRELAASTESFCKSLSVLAACEENSGLSRSLSQLAEAMEKISGAETQQADKDFYLMAEELKDYLALIGVVREVFHERARSWQAWQAAQQNLTKKRENKTRLELAGKSDKVPQALQECTEAERAVDDHERQFEDISKVIRRELDRFNVQRVRDFKRFIVLHLEACVTVQQQIIKHWESFGPEAKAIPL